MKFVKNALVSVGLGLLLQAGSQAAVITQWTYNVSSSWTAASPGGAPPVGVDLTASQLSWGDALLANRSTLTITNPAAGLVDTYVGVGLPPSIFAAPGSTITHANNPIGGTSLATATLRSSLTLNAVLPAGGPTGPTPIDLDILFEETPNATPCAVTASPTPCNDIFVLTTPLQNQLFTWDSDGAGGDAPVDYYVNIFPTTGVLDLLEPAACIAAGIANGICIGFTTPEAQTTALPFSFTVSTEPSSVPEPGSMALAGLALLGLTVARKRAAKV